MARSLGFQKSLESLDFFEGLLEFLVIAIMTIAVFASVQAQVGYVVVISLAIYMVYSLVFGKRSSDMMGHHKTVNHHDLFSGRFLLGHWLCESFQFWAKSIDVDTHISAPKAKILVAVSMLLCSTTFVVRRMMGETKTLLAKAGVVLAHLYRKNISGFLAMPTSDKNLIDGLVLGLAFVGDWHEIVPVNGTSFKKIEATIVDWFHRSSPIRGGADMSIISHNSGRM